jgi:hypothetical protein
MVCARLQSSRWSRRTCRCRVLRVDSLAGAKSYQRKLSARVASRRSAGRFSRRPSPKATWGIRAARGRRPRGSDGSRLPPALLETNLQDQTGRTVSRCNHFFHEIAFRGYQFAIFAARWNFYLGLPQSDPFDRSFTLVSLDRTTDSYQAFAAGLEATIEHSTYSAYCAATGVSLVCAVLRY